MACAGGTMKAPMKRTGPVYAYLSRSVASSAPGCNHKPTGGTMRKNKAAGLIAIITIALLLQTGAGMAGDTSCRTNEYELMSLLIRELYGSEFTLILIDRDTESWCVSEPLGCLTKTWPRLKRDDRFPHSQ